MSAETALWSRDSWESAPDDVLLTQAREGSAEAFGELWRRHLPAAYGVAGKHGGRTPAEDIVAEAATKIFTLLQAGRGPDEHFRAYFLTPVRTVAADHTRRELRLLPVSDDDLELLAEPAEGADGGDFAGGADGGDTELYDTELVRAAFTSLPERDQTVLWHTTVEGEAPRVVAPQLGMTAAAVSSRAMRAREALRAGYLDAYAERCLVNAESRECSWTIERLGRLVRGRLPRRQTERAEAHLASCPHAAAVAADLREIQSGFPALVVPLVLAVGFGSSGLAAALGFAGVGAAGAGAGAAALAAMGEAPGGAAASTGGAVTGAGAATSGGAATGGGALIGGEATGGEAATGAGGAGGTEGTGGTTGEGAGAATESSQLASRLAVALAAGVVALGLAAAALTSGQSDAPAPPSAAATGGPGSVPSAGADGAPTTAATSTTPTTSSTPTPTTSATSTAPLTSAGAASSVAGTSSARRVTSGRSAPPPTASPASALPPASGVAARLLGGGDPSRISLRVPGASTGGSLTVTVSTASGAGSLTAGNRTFTCTQSSRSSLTCVGDGGQIQLVQSGTGGPAPLVVRVRDASGAVTQSVVVPS